MLIKIIFFFTWEDFTLKNWVYPGMGGCGEMANLYTIAGSIN